MRRRYLGLLIFSLLSFSSTSLANTADWHPLQSQATQSYQKGDYQQAEQVVQQAIRVAQKAKNGDAYQASSLSLLAYIYAAQGQVDQALETITKAVQLSRQAHDEHPEQLGQLLFNQGQLRQQAYQLEEALLAYQQAIEQFLILNNTGEGKLWQAVLAQAYILTEKNQHAEAENVLKKAMAGFLENHPYNPKPTSASDLVDLGLLLAQIQMAQQQPYQAIGVLEQARQTLDEHPHMDVERRLRVLEHLATAYDEVQQAADSRALREQALLLRQHKTQPSLVSVMHLNELALRYQADSNYQQADRFYQQALEHLSKMNKSESIEQALLLGNLASLRLAQRQSAEALALFEQSLGLHDQLNQRPLEASQIANYAATIHYNQRRYERAEPLFLKALALLDSLPSVDDDTLLVALDNLASLYSSWDKPGKARPYIQRARHIKAN